MPIDSFAPRLAFYFVSQADFFEEIAKFRAARRVWAKIVKEEFGATKADSMRLRFHCQTAAASLTKPQPYVNVVRTALQALSAVLGGAQSLHTNGLDEAYAIPSEAAMSLALRTQQVIAAETNVTNVVDPLGGSWYVESLTNDIEKATFEYLERVDALGGTVAAIEKGFFQREIADFAYQIAQRKASGEKAVIGVNRYVDPPGTEQPIDVHRIDPATERKQIERLRRVKAARDEARAQRLLKELQAVATDERANVMPIAIECVKARCSMGEMVSALRTIWGAYREVPTF
jgi:methylmalonyl-CoA mutase N-terminal domain/subunit